MFFIIFCLYYLLYLSYLFNFLYIFNVLQVSTLPMHLFVFKLSNVLFFITSFILSALLTVKQQRMALLKLLIPTDKTNLPGDICLVSKPATEITITKALLEPLLINYL